ncbi:MAG: hypothetical protein KC800_26700 [Candidatus Eremiobacteraeota bacterium]|nr:hypothetical protein [Candidatus Eremiobacteraeota bacterium]
MKHHKKETNLHQQREVTDLNARRRRRQERRPAKPAQRRNYELPLIGPNRISVDYLKAA